MAHKKGQGSSRNGRDSNPQFRGIKRFAGEVVGPGHILVRQVGSKFKAGRGVRTGRDFTLYAVTSGVVAFRDNGTVTIVPAADATSKQPAPAAS
jgi:large subunit ribosomal protein L27